MHLVELEGQLTILKLRDCGILPAPGLWGMGLRARCLAAPLLCGDGHQYGGWSRCRVVSSSPIPKPPPGSPAPIPDARPAPIPSRSGFAVGRELRLPRRGLPGSGRRDRPPTVRIPRRVDLARPRQQRQPGRGPSQRESDRSCGLRMHLRLSLRPVPLSKPSGQSHLTKRRRHRRRRHRLKASESPPRFRLRKRSDAACNRKGGLRGRERCGHRRRVCRHSRPRLAATAATAAPPSWQPGGPPSYPSSRHIAQPRAAQPRAARPVAAYGRPRATPPPRRGGPCCPGWWRRRQLSSLASRCDMHRPPRGIYLGSRGRRRDPHGGSRRSARMRRSPSGGNHAQDGLCGRSVS